MSNLEDAVGRHYSVGGIMASIMEALQSQGVDIDALTASDLAPVDEFHTRGRDSTIELATRGDCPAYLAEARRVEGELLATSGQWDAAAAAFDEAIVTHDSIGSRIVLARTLLSRASLWERCEEPSRRDEDRARAREILAQCGAHVRM